MPHVISRLHRRLSICAAALLSVAGTADAEDGGLGPWEIEAVYKNDVFDRCAIRRVLDSEISATFLKTPNATTLLLTSPHWQLEFGKSYPVTIKLGRQRWESQVGADVNSVSMAIEGPKFVSGLRDARALDVVGAGATIRVPLDGSASAFARLDRCVAENGNLRAANSDTPLRIETATNEDAPGTETASPADGQPPRPPAKPGTDTAAGEVTNVEPPASSAQGPPAPPAKPEIEARVEDSSADDAAAAAEDENASPPAAKPKTETAKKASAPKKRSTSSSAQSAKRAFQREMERLRSFFGN